MTADELKAKRREYGLTQSQLADALEIHRVTVANYEAGKQPIPRLLELALIGLAYSTAPDPVQGQELKITSSSTNSTV